MLCEAVDAPTSNHVTVTTVARAIAAKKPAR
jgi:hypothetical protein